MLMSGTHKKKTPLTTKVASNENTRTGTDATSKLIVKRSKLNTNQQQSYKQSNSTEQLKPIILNPIDPYSCIKPSETSVHIKSHNINNHQTFGDLLPSEFMLSLRDRKHGKQIPSNTYISLKIHTPRSRKDNDGPKNIQNSNGFDEKISVESRIINSKPAPRSSNPPKRAESVKSSVKQAVDRPVTFATGVTNATPKKHIDLLRNCDRILGLTKRSTTERLKDCYPLSKSRYSVETHKLREHFKQNDVFLNNASSTKYSKDVSKPQDPHHSRTNACPNNGCIKADDGASKMRSRSTGCTKRAKFKRYPRLGMQQINANLADDEGSSSECDKTRVKQKQCKTINKRAELQVACKTQSKERTTNSIGRRSDQIAKSLDAKHKLDNVQRYVQYGSEHQKSKRSNKPSNTHTNRIENSCAQLIKQYKNYTKNRTVSPQKYIQSEGYNIGLAKTGNKKSISDDRQRVNIQEDIILASKSKYVRRYGKYVEQKHSQTQQHQKEEKRKKSTKVSLISSNSSYLNTKLKVQLDNFSKRLTNPNQKSLNVGTVIPIDDKCIKTITSRPLTHSSQIKAKSMAGTAMSRKNANSTIEKRAKTKKDIEYTLNPPKTNKPTKPICNSHSQYHTQSITKSGDGVSRTKPTKSVHSKLISAISVLEKFQQAKWCVVSAPKYAEYKLGQEGKFK